MSAEDRIQIIKDQNKARAKKYYEANKEAIAERRKAQRAECRKAMGKEPAPAPAPAPAPKAPAVAKKAPAPEPVPVEAPAPQRMTVKRPITVAQAKAKADAKSKKMNYEQAVEIIDSSDAIQSDASRVLYRNHLKTVYSMLECKDLITCFTDAEETIAKIDDAKQKRDPTKGYAINSKKSFVQLILKLSDVLSIPLSKETKQAYVDAFDALKLDSAKQTEVRIEEGKKEEQLTFADYLPQVAETFGENSTEYLVASLYSVHGFRDNLQLRIVKAPDAKGDNQLILPVKRGEPYKILLSQYKTGNKYGPKTITLPDDISKRIALYTAKNKKQLGGSLFGTDKLSGFISKFNKEMGLPVSINTYRQMLVSPVIDGMDSKERVELAKKMGHSVATSAHYKQKKK